MRQVVIAHFGCVFNGNSNVRGRTRRLYGSYLKVARQGSIRLHKACLRLNTGMLDCYSRGIHCGRNTYRDRHIILGSSNGGYFMNMRVRVGL